MKRILALLLLASPAWAIDLPFFYWPCNGTVIETPKDCTAVIKLAPNCDSLTVPRDGKVCSLGTIIGDKPGWYKFTLFHGKDGFTTTYLIQNFRSWLRVGDVYWIETLGTTKPGSLLRYTVSRYGTKLALVCKVGQKVEWWSYAYGAAGSFDKLCPLYRSNGGTKGMGKVTTVRETPNGRVIGMVGIGTRVRQILDYSGSFVLIRYGEKYGWVPYSTLSNFTY